MNFFEILAFVSFLLTFGGAAILFGRTLSAVKSLHDRMDEMCANTVLVANEEKITKKENGAYRLGEPARVREYRINEAPLRKCEDRFVIIQNTLTNVEKQLAVLVGRSEKR
jgi:hypothetical protein